MMKNDPKKELKLHGPIFKNLSFRFHLKNHHSKKQALFSCFCGLACVTMQTWVTPQLISHHVTDYNLHFFLKTLKINRGKPVKRMVEV